MDEVLIFSVWECRGCESLLAVRKSFLDSDRDHADDHSTEYLPERTNSEKAAKKHFLKISQIQRGLYGEIVDSFNSEAFILCSAGLRALLESICKDKAPSSSSSLQARIDALAAVVPAAIIRNLHGFRFLGNRAVHDLQRPTRAQLALAIEVIEDLMASLYELDYKSARLYQMVKVKESK